MRLPLLVALTAICAVASCWWWLGRPVAMPPAATDGKLECVSYSPFRGEQTPLQESAPVPAWQIEEDLVRLAPVTRCIRTYSIQHGLDQIPAIAERHGLKVLLGLWLSSRRDKNQTEVEGTIALAKRYPGVVTGIVVGNEVLLRGELSAVDLGGIIRTVKAAVPVPVTYADVWEFWLRNRDLASAVDFITIHILPYWEDIPVPAAEAGAHVESIVHRVADVFPGRDILVGEVGWPSAGRMREGALPSLSNQALVVQDVLERAGRGGFRVNVIEAFDQPWKRRLEGTVGGYWGLLTDAGRTPKFVLGKPVSDHPDWTAGALLGAGLALLAVAIAGLIGWREHLKVSALAWGAIGLDAAAAGVLVPLAFEAVQVESLGWGGWVRGGLLAAAAIGSPLVGAVLLARGEPLPSFAAVLGGRDDRARSMAGLIAAGLLVLVTVLAVQTALGLVFDPRYRDFPFAALTAGTVPFLLVAALQARSTGRRGNGETAAAATIGLSALFILFNETAANWQAVWLAAILAALVVTLLRVRVAPGS